MSRKPSEPPPLRPHLLALIERCKHELDADDARLILADWLEEHGDLTDRARAALIRLDILSGEDKGRPDFHSLRQRTWDRLRPRCAPFPPNLRKFLSGCWRGLLHAEVTATALTRPDCVRWAGTEAWAWVEQVSLQPRTTGLDTVLASPLLNTVTTLSLRHLRFAEHSFAALARRLVNIRRLSLPNATFEGQLRLLVSSPHAAPLRSLHLSAAQLTTADFAALAEPDSLPDLDDLELPQTGTVDNLAAILAVPRRIGSLTLHGPTASTALGQVASAGHFARAKNLCLVNASPEPLTRGAFWPGLQSLHLYNRVLTPADAVTLASVPAASLRSLWLQLGEDADRILARLVESPLFGGLTNLDIRYCPLGQDGITALTAMRTCPASLILAGCKLGDAGLTALARWPGLSTCRVLSLAVNDITAAGIGALADSPHVGGLLSLNLHGNPLGDEGAERLLNAPWIGGLEQLLVGNSDGGDRARRVLVAAAGRMPRMKELNVGKELLSDTLREAFAHVGHVD